MRLDKFVCKSTDLSRKAATGVISAGRVLVNGCAITEARTQVHENNEILLDGERLVARPFRYLLMHKPAGYVCSNIDEAYPSLFNLIDIENKAELHIAGRLDADTTGLVLITDDGRWSFDIIRPTQHCEKLYRVGLRDPIGADVADIFAAGVMLQGENAPTRPAKLAAVSDREALLSITEGKFHQVKRMFAAVGNRVVRLHREQIGNINLDLPEGQWRYLSESEISSFSDK